jgi:cytochrome c oxidase subunit 4
VGVFVSVAVPGGESVMARKYVVVYVVLMGLLAATVGAAYLHLGNLTIVAALTIAVAKTSLILLYFMHIRFSGRRLWVFAVVGFLWLAILLTLAMTDYLSRGWIPLPTGWE